MGAVGRVSSARTLTSIVDIIVRLVDTHAVLRKYPRKLFLKQDEDSLTFLGSRLGQAVAIEESHDVAFLNPLPRIRPIRKLLSG